MIEQLVVFQLNRAAAGHRGGPNEVVWGQACIDGERAGPILHSLGVVSEHPAGA